MPKDHRLLTRRERQIMDVLYERKRGTVAEVLKGLPDPPSYSSVRTFLRILEEKGYVRHEKDPPRYVFIPTVPRSRARQSAIRHLVQTFFDGSWERAVAALLDTGSTKLSDEDLDRLADLIEEARKDSSRKSVR
jgi:predicted transcriptional regulator